MIISSSPFILPTYSELTAVVPLNCCSCSHSQTFRNGIRIHNTVVAGVRRERIESEWKLPPLLKLPRLRLTNLISIFASLET